MALEDEVKFFESMRAEFLKVHAGKFALIKGRECIGFFDDDVRAFEVGVEKFGTEPFLIKRVLPSDPNETIPALVCGLLSDASV
jgi:hypothetical protein